MFPYQLFSEIRNITEINFSEKKFDDMLENFMKAEGYNYRYINTFNLPYSFLNAQKSINLNGQFILNSFVNKKVKGTQEKEIEVRINNSNYFEVQKGKIVKKDKTSNVNMGLYLTNHVINKDNES